MARMRTIEQAYDIIHTNDPDSAVSMWLIKNLVKTGAIPCIKSGKKYLINFDALEAYLSGSLPVNCEVI